MAKTARNSTRTSSRTASKSRSSSRSSRTQKYRKPFLAGKRNVVIGVLVGIVFAIGGAIFLFNSFATTVEGNNFGVSVGADHMTNGDTDAQLDAEMQRISGTGAKWFRTDIAWQHIEYLGQGQYDWHNYDRIVNAARKYNLNVVGVVSLMPNWLTNGQDTGLGPTTDTQRQAYANFCVAAARHYASSITTWELWNEPNTNGAWNNPDPVAYAAMVKVANYALHNTSDLPAERVLLGGSGWPDLTNGKDIKTVDWYNALYANGIQGNFDAANVHPYPDISYPPGNSDFGGQGEMGTAADVYNIMNSHGDGNVPMWATETGAPTNGQKKADGSPKDYITDDVQAQLVPAIMSKWEAIPNHGPIFWYTHKDDLKYGATTNREAYFGLEKIDTDGVTVIPKASYDAWTTYVKNHSTDTQAPTVSITYPTTGTTMAGTAYVTVNYSDNVGVTKSTLYVDGQIYHSNLAAPFWVWLDTTKFAKGTHTLTMYAYDAANNVGKSGTVTINIDNTTGDTTKPKVAITSPANNSTMTGTGYVNVNVSDNVAVAKTTLYVDDRIYHSATAAPFSVWLDITKFSRGPHKLTMYAYDSSGNQAISSPITVNFSY